MHLLKSLIAAGVLALVAVAPAGAQTVLQKAVISAGGASSSSSASRLDYTIAQPAAGIATNGQTVGQFGFWTASGSVILSVDDERAGTISSMRLYPNPIAETAHISLALATPTVVEISLFDAAGRLIATRSTGRLEAGEHDIALDVSGLASGSYSVVASVDGAMTRVPMSVVR